MLVLGGALVLEFFYLSTEHGSLERLFQYKIAKKDLSDICSNFHPWLLRWSKEHCLGHVLRVRPLLTQTQILFKH